MACVCPLKGAGVMYLIDRAATNNYASFSFGNASEWSINATSEEESLPDYTDPTFAPCVTDEQISGVELSGTGYEFCPQTKGYNLQGAVTAEAAAAQAAVPYVAWPKGFVELHPLPDMTASVLVTNLGGTVTYTEGTDYMLGYSGLYIYESGSIPAPSNNTTPNVEITFTGLATSTVQALTEFGNREYTAIFDMYNTGAGGKPQRTRIHRIKPKTFTAFPLMGQTFQNMPLTTSVLPDQSITLSGLSKYFTSVAITPSVTV